jgi:chromosome segregation ATPase
MADPPVIGLDGEEALDPFAEHMSPFSPSLQSRLSALAEDVGAIGGGVRLDFSGCEEVEEVGEDPRIATLEADLEESRSNERLALGELAQVRRDMAKLRDEYSTLQRDAATESAALRQQVAQLALAADAERVALLSRLDRAENQIGALEAERTMLGGMVDDLQGEVVRLSDEAARLADLRDHV